MVKLGNVRYLAITFQKYFITFVAMNVNECITND